jgi:hypothetical protein
LILNKQALSSNEESHQKYRNNNLVALLENNVGSLIRLKYKLYFWGDKAKPSFESHPSKIFLLIGAGSPRDGRILTAGSPANSNNLPCVNSQEAVNLHILSEGGAIWIIANFSDIEFL